MSPAVSDMTSPQNTASLGGALPPQAAIGEPTAGALPGQLLAADAADGAGEDKS